MISSSSIQFWSGFIPVNRSGRIYPTLAAISLTPTLHLAWFMAFFFSNPTLLPFFSTYVFHVFFGHPRFLLPFTSNSNAFLRKCPSSLLNICPYHLTPFAFAISTTVSFNPNISITSSGLFFSISFAPHIALTITVSVLLKIAISFSLRHHITLPILHNSDKPFLSPSARTFLSSPSQFLLLLWQLPRNHHLHSPYPPNNRNLSPFPPLHTNSPPVPLIHQLASCIFHTQRMVHNMTIHTVAQWQ